VIFIICDLSTKNHDKVVVCMINCHKVLCMNGSSLMASSKDGYKENVYLGTFVGGSQHCPILINYPQTLKEDCHH
jgi:hypothetical protein